ncbi:sulfotransferase [Thioalkalivibrio thiocyanodenitrificans]|uniref:sulfotransferase n=1 Tax=Thioalkalivibrio thiocyanodenitrificans TaxID=243063 RepID=UPI0018DB4FE0|nr:sulfotransferase [Thioalkalivibrio thiocyanodenitrificans]
MTRATYRTPPLVIAGTGGSGTRLVALMCQHAGYHLGSRLNQTLDAIDFYDFHERWLTDYLAGTLSHSREEAMRRELLDVVATFHDDLPAGHHGPWGWKAPRSMLLLPLLDNAIAGLRFLHVVRDGRDMAYSANQNQLQKHGLALLDDEQRLLPQWQQSLAFWQAANLRTADYGEQRMGDRYLRLRYEDLLSENTRTLEMLADFLAIPSGHGGALLGHSRMHPGVGRWRQRPAEEQRLLQALGAEGLGRFGYMPE